MSKPEVEAKIEFQKVIGEVNPGSYQTVRFSRVKYKQAQKHILILDNYKKPCSHRDVEMDFIS